VLSKLHSQKLSTPHPQPRTEGAVASALLEAFERHNSALLTQLRELQRAQGRTSDEFLAAVVASQSFHAL
jgi:hypothetical protein